MNKAKRIITVILTLGIGIMAALALVACYSKHEHNAGTDGKCLICGKAAATAGLKYELDKRCDSYIITGFEGEDQNVVIPSKYNGKPVTGIENSAFYWCGITSIEMPDTVTNIGDEAFYNCNKLLHIAIPDGVKHIGKSTFEGCSSLMSIKLPVDLESIGDLAFYGCVLLESVQISDSVVSIGDRAFSNCYSLKYKECDNSRYLGNDGNPYLVLLKANVASTSFEVNAATKFIHSGAFAACTRLVSVTMGDNVISIGSTAFNACYALMNIELSDSLISIGNYAFTYSGLTSIELPEGLISIGDYAFASCGITYMEMPGSVTNLGQCAFADSRITSIEIPQSVTSIGQYAFAGCSALTEAILDCTGDIGYFAFATCNNLKSIVIGDEVGGISDGAFAECSGLSSVYYEGTVNEWSAVKLGLYNESLVSATIYYYSESEPTEEGNYWHYDSDGEITVW